MVNPVNKKLQSLIDKANCMDDWCIDRAGSYILSETVGYYLWLSQKPKCPSVLECVSGTSISGCLAVCHVVVWWSLELITSLQISNCGFDPRTFRTFKFVTFGLLEYWWNKMHAWEGLRFVWYCPWSLLTNGWTWGFWEGKIKQSSPAEHKGVHVLVAVQFLRNPMILCLATINVLSWICKATRC